MNEILKKIIDGKKERENFFYFDERDDR